MYGLLFRLLWIWWFLCCLGFGLGCYVGVADLVVWVIVEFGLDACIVGLFVWMVVLGCC